MFYRTPAGINRKPKPEKPLLSKRTSLVLTWIWVLAILLAPVYGAFILVTIIDYFLLGKLASAVLAYSMLFVWFVATEVFFFKS